MNRTETIQEMQMCLDCSPFFERGVGEILAHDIGMHVKVWQDGFNGLDSERHDFQNESCFGVLKKRKEKHKD